MKEQRRTPFSRLLRVAVAIPFAVSMLCTGSTASALAAATATDLFGRSLSSFPHFDYQQGILKGSSGEIALDPRFLTSSKTCTVYVVSGKSAAQWAADPTLVEVRGGMQTKTFGLTSIQNNTLALTGIANLNAATAWSNRVVRYSQGYDLVLDCDNSGTLTNSDYIDGAGDEDGFYVIPDGTVFGMHSVTMLAYMAYGIPSGPTYEPARLYYPSDIQTIPTARPLVVVSHGNGPSLENYDHISRHLASWGYIVLTHANATDLGPSAAANTTLEHTYYLLAFKGVLAGGAIAGKVDQSRIVFNGHSRGGEGAVIAYTKLANGLFAQPNPQMFASNDVVLISAMAPSNFRYDEPTGALLGPASPKTANFHLWLSTADGDVQNSWPDEVTQSPQIFGRAEGARSSTSILGASHGAYYDSTGGPENNIECSVNHAEEERIVDAYSLAVMAYYSGSDLGAREVLWSQWDVLKPGNVPVHPNDRCGQVYSTFRPHPTFLAVLDDYQSQPSTGMSSSGGPVTANVVGVREAVLRDNSYPPSSISPFDLYNWNSAAASSTKCYCSTLLGSCLGDGGCAGGTLASGGAWVNDGACTGSSPSGPFTCAPSSRASCYAQSGDPCPIMGLGTCTYGCVTSAPNDPMNGSTYAGYGDTESGVVFEWPNDGMTRYYRWALPPSLSNISTYDYLTLRVAEVTNRFPTSTDGFDLDLSIEMKDTSGVFKNVRLSAYGYGIGDPFVRSTFYNQGGYSNEFETIRIRLRDFQNNATNGPNLNSIAEIRIRVGSAVGSAEGRIIVDDVGFAKK